MIIWYSRDRRRLKTREERAAQRVIRLPRVGGQALESVETKAGVIPAGCRLGLCATGNNQYTKECVVTSTVEVTVTGKATC